MSFADGIYCNIERYTKIIFIPENLYTQTLKKILFTYGFFLIPNTESSLEQEKMESGIFEKSP